MKARVQRVSVDAAVIEAKTVEVSYTGFTAPSPGE
jgi:hypothetical protein